MAFGASQRTLNRSSSISEVDRTLAERSRMIAKQLEELDKSMNGQMEGPQTPSTSLRRGSRSVVAVPLPLGSDPFSQLASVSRRRSVQLSGGDTPEPSLSSSRHGDRRDGGSSRRGSAVSTDSVAPAGRRGSSGMASVLTSAPASGSATVDEAYTSLDRSTHSQTSPRGANAVLMLSAGHGRRPSSSSADQLVDELERSVHESSGTAKSGPPLQPTVRPPSRSGTLIDELDKSIHSTATGLDSSSMGGRAANLRMPPSRSTGSLASAASVDSPVADRQSMLARTARMAFDSADTYDGDGSQQSFSSEAAASSYGGGASTSTAQYDDDENDNDTCNNFGFRPIANTARRASDVGRRRSGSGQSAILAGSSTMLQSQSTRTAPSKR